MLYKISHSVPANTTTDNPDWQKLQISRGIIIQWIVFMPEEAADLLKVRVVYHGTQILPYTGKDWIYGLFKPTVIEDRIQIQDPPFELDIYAVNEDDSYSHEYNIYVNISPPEPVRPGGVPPSIVERFKGLFGGGS